MRPARGWSCEGSGRAASPRKEETSAALLGSKAVVWKGEGDGSWEVGECDELEEDEVEDDCDCDCFWPVRVPQSDILVELNYYDNELAVYWNLTAQ